MRTAILFLINLICAFGRLTVRPQNVAVIAGERMTMECRVDEESRVRKWDLFDINRVTTTVYTHSNEGGGIIHEKFGHFGVQVNANGSGILFANSTKMEDAGNYTCIAKINNKDSKFSAQLIVFESEPKCETNLTRNDGESLSVGDFVWMRCSVVFRGFWTPTFDWRQHLENGETGIEGRTVTDGVVQYPSSNVTSTLSIPINPATNGSYFSCKIAFADYDGKGSSDTTATNLPDFNYTWESDVIRLSYSPVSFDTTGSSADRTTLDMKPSVSADTQSVREDPSDRYFSLLMVVAGLSLFLVLIVIIAIAFCIHYKRKVSGKISTSSALDRTERQKRPNTGIYDIIPYAVTDNYETIDEMEMEDTTADEMKQRRATDDPHDSQGYSGLLSTQPTPPAVYSRMNHCERPFNAPDHAIDPNANETNNSDANEGRREEPSEDITSRNAVESHPYLELSCDPTDKTLVDEKVDACRNINPTVNDALDENVIDSRNSNNESPTSYNNFNYETPQLPLTMVQVSPTETSAYTNLLSTGVPQQINPDIPTADCATKGIRTLPKPPPRKL